MPGSWNSLHNAPPTAVSFALLLTDGRVMAEGLDQRWFALSPDAQGSYVNGSWGELTPSPQSRLFFASAVLADGRVIFVGAEEGSASGQVEIFDPVANTWSDVAAPTWADGGHELSDCPCALLDDGTVLIGRASTDESAIFDPATSQWTLVPGRGGRAFDEETWTLLRDGSVLTAEVFNAPLADRYIGGHGWVSAGRLTQDIAEHAPQQEIGPAVLLPDGTVFAIGGNGHTAVYTPPAAGSTDAGTWSSGPDFPATSTGAIQACPDGPAALLPNGRVLCVAGPIVASGGLAGFGQPISFFEYDGTRLVPIANPDRAASDATFHSHLLVLPSGEVLFTDASDQVRVYTPDAADGAPAPQWRPEITSCVAQVETGYTYVLSGNRLCGISQASAYGDDASPATNYPIVKLRRGTDVVYCRTFGRTPTGVGDTTGQTSFQVPWLEGGDYQLTVVANGIESAPCTVQVAARNAPRSQPLAWNKLVGSLADGQLWTLGPHGFNPVGPLGADEHKNVAAANKTLADAMQGLADVSAKVTSTSTAKDVAPAAWTMRRRNRATSASTSTKE